MSNPRTEQDAIVCYVLSKRQGAEMIAQLMDKSVEEVEQLIAWGEQLVKERDNKEQP